MQLCMWSPSCREVSVLHVAVVLGVKQWNAMSALNMQKIKQLLSRNARANSVNANVTGINLLYTFLKNVDVCFLRL